MSLAFSPPLSSTAREGDEDDSTLNSTAFHLKPFNVRESTPIGKKSGLQPRACCGSSSRALTTRENRNNRRSVNSTEGDEDEYGTAFRLKPFDVRQSTPVGKKSGNRDDCGLHPSRRRACCGSSSRAITIRENRNNRREAPRYDPPPTNNLCDGQHKEGKVAENCQGWTSAKSLLQYFTLLLVFILLVVSVYVWLFVSSLMR
jgi:hypothetical protein